MRLWFSNVWGWVNPHPHRCRNGRDYSSAFTTTYQGGAFCRRSNQNALSALFLACARSLRCPAHVRLHCSSHEAKEGEPRCWSVFTASVERKGGRARADDLEGVQRQRPYLGEVPRGDSATAYLFLHFYFFFILFHSTAFISLSCQFRRTSAPALCPTQARHCIFCWHACSKGGNAPFFSFTATRLDYKS